jgi:signal transduction histidine kinase
VSTPVRSAPDIFARYERERRLRLLRVIAPLFYIIESLFLVGIVGVIIWQAAQGNLGGSGGFSLLVSGITSVVINVVYGLAWLATRREQASRAAWLIIGFTTISLTVSDLSESARDGATPLVLALLAGYLVTIALAGVLGDRPLLIATTLLAVVGSLATVIIGAQIGISGAASRAMPPPAPGGGPPLQLPPAVTVMPSSSIFIAAAVFFAIADLAMLAVFLGVQQSSRASLRDINNLQIEIDRARQLDELKDQFISSVNHELRNPIMGMLAHLDNMVNAPETVPVLRFRHNSGRAMGAALSLRKLVDSILDARRLDVTAKDFTPAPVNLRAAVYAAVELLDPAESKNVPRDLHIRLADNLTVLGDEVRIQQIVTNLISNAMKYSAAGTSIEVVGQIKPEPVPNSKKRGGAKPVAPLPPMAELTVRDFGLGVPPEQIPLLFHRFVRLPRDLASRTLGNGMGLYLCKVLAEAMGGGIWAESAGVPGQGTTFHVTLPLVVTPVPVTVAAPPEPVSA